MDEIMIRAQMAIADAKAAEKGEWVRTTDAIVAALKAYDEEVESGELEVDVRALEHRVGRLEQAQKADAPASAPDINAPSTWPEVKPEDVRIGDVYITGGCHVVAIDCNPTPDGWIHGVDVHTGESHTHRVKVMCGTNFRRPPLEVGQAVRLFCDDTCGTISRISHDGTRVYVNWDYPKYYYPKNLTPLGIAPSLDPRRKD